MELQDLVSVANELRVDIVRMIGAAGSGHPGGSLSCVEILESLYCDDVMTYDVNNPDLPNHDWFIMAKGHAAPALYAVLAKVGYLPHEELITLRKLGSRLQGHPDSNRIPGVVVSTGSLGQGLSIAAGTAAGLRVKEDTGTVFTLLGDGECEEGQIWEAAMFSAHYRLDNLVAIVDHNGLQIDGAITDVCNPEDLGEKFRSFGWGADDVDGHDLVALKETLMKRKLARDGKPQVVIAHTVKGKGVSFMEHNVGWHGKAPNAQELKQALKDLNAADSSTDDAEEVHRG